MMSSYVQEDRRQVNSPLMLGAALGGIAWIAVVVWFLMYSLERAQVVAAQGIIAEPSSAQVVVAYVLAAVFALPGIGLIVYGFARLRKAGDDGHEASG